MTSASDRDDLRRKVVRLGGDTALPWFRPDPLGPIQGLHFAYPDYSEVTVFRCRRADSEASRAPQ